MGNKRKKEDYIKALFEDDLDRAIEEVTNEKFANHDEEKDRKKDGKEDKKSSRNA